MEPGKIRNHTRALGAPSNWDPERDGRCGVLHIRDEVHGRMPIMVSAWTPSELERARIAEGHPVILTVIGNAHPPVSIEVGHMVVDVE